ncbi:PREDICTED: uncharacterized protein LOC104704628 [Camelina sativa]|uniref:Uncharacterized protein LOC104704628 n=1 Tax=Camelina sativa TaxID=90675 RepID=A0ABM0T0L7_CAMSA|nr:PREDICTED: uncharacterized protein LOC104704628 [Camelina sativa]
MGLNVRNKLGFFDGTIQKPPVDHPSHGSWSRCNDMVSTWLMNSVSKKIGASLLYISTVEGIWNNLLSRFKQDNAPCVYEIEQRLTCIQQGSLDVSAYYTELVTLWEEYKNYIELPVCTCGRCECNAAVLWERLQDRSRVTKFLMGLNESYEQTRRHILMLKPIPSMEEAYNMVTQDERQSTVSLKPPVKSDNVAFQTTGSYEGDLANGSYVVEPYEYVAAYNTYRPRSNRPMCTDCGKMGHMIQTCFKPRVVANVQVNGGMPYYPPAPVNALNLDVSQLTQSQAQDLINQLSRVQATEPMINQLSRVQILENSAPTVSQSLASNTKSGVMAPQSSSGIVFNISSNLRYENSNLTYKHHCLSSLHSVLPNGAWIIDSGATSHESSQGWMIGSANLFHNLCILNEHSLSTPAKSPVINQVSGSLVNEGILWHQRLGHPSNAKLQLMSEKHTDDLFFHTI